ncbi:MAG TPA: YraN family protein [Thermoanaerobaculia bacterium]
MPVLHGHDRQRQGRDGRRDRAVRRAGARAEGDADGVGLTPRAVLDRLLDVLRPGSRDYRGLRGVGQRWERLARRRLETEGYEILEANYRSRARGCEIDFVAREGGILCFVEVKGRSGPAFGTPAEAVTEEKQRRIVRAAEQYLARISPKPDCRFDVVAIVESERGGTEIEILRGAFEAGPER